MRYGARVFLFDGEKTGKIGAKILELLVADTSFFDDGMLDAMPLLRTVWPRR